MSKLATIVAYLDRYPRHAEVADYPGAWNGLQVENSGVVKRIGAAADACAWKMEQAVDKGISLFLVHHGLFWAGVQPVAGVTRRSI